MHLFLFLVFPEIIDILYFVEEETLFRTWEREIKEECRTELKVASISFLFFFVTVQFSNGRSIRVTV